MSPILQQLGELLLHGASQTPDRPVEALLAEAVRRAVLSADVTVLWRSHLSTGLTTAAGAACTDLRSPAAPLGDEETRAATWPPLLAYPGHKQFARKATMDGETLLLGLGRRDGRRINEVFVRIRPTEPPSGPIIVSLAEAAQLEYSQLAHLYAILSALHGANAARRQADFRQAVSRLLARTAPDPISLLPDATRLIQQTRAELAHPWFSEDLLLLGEQVAEWCLHSLLGSAWSPQRLAAPDAQAVLADLCAALRQFQESLPRLAALDRWSLSLSARLGHIEAALRALLSGPPEAPDWSEASGDGAALALLAAWIGTHTRARAIDRVGGAGPADDDAWAEATEATRQQLGRLLAAWLPNTPRAAHTRNWMRLWFALQLLQPPTDAPGAPDRLPPDKTLDAERWRFRADLAYIVQESLRFALYEQRPGYRAQPPAYAAALRTLVSHHARLDAGVPRELDIDHHLTDIAEGDGGAGYRFAAGHLQHVLEIYIGGHLLLSLQLTEAETVAHRLAGGGAPAGPQARAALRTAFSVAALFHDTGVLLFPRAQVPEGVLRAGDRGLSDAMLAVTAQIRAAGSDLGQRCLDVLTQRSLLDPVSEAALDDWIRDQCEDGQPNHALLGAWYVALRCEATGALPDAIVRGAARAVLLHSAVTQPIDPDLDPAAALLVLCDELFDWEPSVASGPSPNAIGRSLHAAAVEHNPLRSRAAMLRVDGLSAAVGDDGALSLSLETAERWPQISVTLQPPGVMPEPAMRIWLTMAQNIGRIRAAQSGWGPTVLLHARIPPRVALVVGGSAALLDRTLHSTRLPVRTRLQSWLALQETSTTDGVELFWVRATGKALSRGDIRHVMPALKAETLEVLEDLEQRKR